MKRWIAALITAVTIASLSSARADDLTAPAFSVGGSYYQNSDYAHRHDESLNAVIPVSSVAATIEGDTRWANDPHGSVSTQDALVGLNAHCAASCSLKARAGVVRFTAGAKPAGMLDIVDKGAAGEVRFRAEYTPLFETADMIRNEIMFAGIELDGKAALHRRWTPAAHLFLRDYSDNNDSLRVRGDLPYAVLLSPVRWEVGYRQEYSAFRRQTHHGYFDPDELHSFQGVTSISYWTEEMEAYVEVFGGLQKSRRSGTSNTDEFYGVYAEAVLKKLGSFQFALTAEGDDYSLGSASGFRHVLIGVRLTRII